jgi:HD-like signal output (HDOD) protein
MNAKNPQLIRKNLETVSTIPTLSIVIDKITRLLENPQTSAEEIGKVITTDQALAAKVLRLVNSAFYGFPGKISTITHAVVILGFSTIKNIVLTASIFDAFKKKKNTESGFNIEQFWLHSIGCGAASLAIAKHIGFKEKEECFIAGLIHDVGKIILCYFFPEEFEAVIQNARSKNILFLKSEQEILGITHDEIGAIITRRWNLPANLQAVVQNHHCPSHEKDGYSMTAIVHTADILTRAMEIGNGGDEKMPLILEAAWRDLGFDHIPFESLLEGIDDEFDKATIFMQIL